jgi:hypothetical protein
MYPSRWQKAKRKRNSIRMQLQGKNSISMKGVFWNCRSLRDLAKHTFLHDVAGDNQLDFIALSETNKNSVSTQCRQNFCAGADFVWHWRSPRGMSRGC